MVKGIFIICRHHRGSRAILLTVRSHVDPGHLKYSWLKAPLFTERNNLDGDDSLRCGVVPPCMSAYLLYDSAGA